MSLLRFSSFAVSSISSCFIYDHSKKNRSFKASNASSTVASSYKNSTSIIAEVRERRSSTHSVFRRVNEIRTKLFNSNINFFRVISTQLRRPEMRRPLYAPTRTFLGKERKMKNWFQFFPASLPSVWEIALMTKQCDWKADINLSLYTF